MACTLDENYIQSSDSYILEKLKNCNDFSDQQIKAMETVICSGNTTYGNSSTWTEKTLEQLDILPLYLTENFWKHISAQNKSKFLKKFMKKTTYKQDNEEETEEPVQRMHHVFEIQTKHW
nr:mesothelin-like protein [Salvelinus alpinus]